jgi:hypothetical protein
MAAILGFMLLAIQRQIGWSSALALPLVAIFGLGLAVIMALRHRDDKTDLRSIAHSLEARHPELDGRLITAVQQEPRNDGRLDFLQIRLIEEAVRESERTNWPELIPNARLQTAKLAHWVALLVLLAVLWDLRTVSGPHLLARISESTVTVTPGDTILEKGNSLVVLARFNGPLPPGVELVFGGGSSDSKRIPLVKSLADPMFGGSVPEVASNLVYHVEYAGQRTRDYNVKVFEYPRLERADADLSFPEYTRQPPKRIEDTKRISAVEGSRLDLSLQLNKPVVSAQFVARDKAHKTISMVVESNRPAAALKQFLLENSMAYDLNLVDAEGRTNKVAAQFVFEVLTNRTPELRLASPRGDLRPSPLEEINFEGTVWDDFGVQAYGLGYTLAGTETKFIELGQDVPAKEKRTFKHLLHLEELGVQPDQLLAWFVWADDTGPDGQIRRTTGDLYFAEVRPFDEIFREGMAMDGQSGQQQQRQGGQGARLAELQKQIINATWRLQRDHAGAKKSSERGHQSGRVGASSRGSLAVGESSGRTSASPGTLSYSKQQGLLAVIPLTLFLTQADEPEDTAASAPRSAPKRATSAGPPTYEDDAIVVRDSQAQALQEANAASRRQQDPRGTILWSAATREMERALARLNEATNSPQALAEAVAAEQAAYQALLKLQQHEYQVSRSSRSQSGGGKGDQMQRQLEQMDMTQSENRYETQRQAQKPQTAQRNEDLQVMSRLQELARRQQDLNDRLKELQTALQEAKNDQEREEIKRRLKRLQEEEQQMLADVDEVRQRMDRPENQSRMTEERRQLEQTRQDVQKAAEAAGQGSPSQALASGTRAQRQFQDMREQMRKENSNQFAEDLKEMRSQARELARQQEEITRKLEQGDSDKNRKSLSDSNDRQKLLDQLAHQKELMTNLTERASQVSQQAEDAEPLLSHELYDTVRKFNQDTSRNVKETEAELMNRGMMTQSAYDRLKDPTEQDGAKLLDLTSELLRLDAGQKAAGIAQRSKSGIDELKRGVERAAESVLGDDTEALRQAEQQLDQLTEQLKRELARTQSAGPGTNEQQQAGNSLGGTNEPGRSLSSLGDTNIPSAGEASAQGRAGQTDSRQPGKSDRPGGQNAPGLQNEKSQSSSQQASTQEQTGQTSGDSQQPGQSQGRGQGAQGDSSQLAQDGRDRNTSNSSRRGNTAGGSRNNWTGGGAEGGDWTDYLHRDWNKLPDQPFTGPITGNDYGPWADGLRDVEEMIDAPDLRNEVAKARERVRLLRQEYKRDLKKPDWAVVNLQIVKPLVEVRNRIADELARRENSDALVPIDRDPVPNRYSDLVRKYYEELGKAR